MDPSLILIVEDDRDNREGYAEYLSTLGFEVAQAATGAEALERAFALLPDILLMDLSLPGIDGWDVARALRADARTRHTPIVALSACVFPADIARASEVGCDSFMSKPCYPQAVAEEIGRVLAQRRTRMPIDRTSPQPTRKRSEPA